MGGRFFGQEDRPLACPGLLRHVPHPCLGGRGQAGLAWLHRELRGGGRSLPRSPYSPPLPAGFVVGQAGLYEALGMFVVAYVIIGMTVLSVCAISTNGALDAGGAYYMISRALGPEFGGSIGIMFFLANVCGSALYILGLVEAIVDIFGVPLGQTMGSSFQVLPRSYWYELLYGTALLLVCLLVCLVGASIYAKATFLIFLIVMLVLGTVFVSFFAVGPTVPSPGVTPPSCVTQGYTLMCRRTLLQKDYGFLRDINVWPPFVIIGIYSSTLSASMSNLIGASRILYALAKDDIFGRALAPAKKTSRGGNPWVAVILSWVLVQVKGLGSGFCSMFVAHGSGVQDGSINAVPAGISPAWGEA
ncbi:Solute carrier family 12 member 9 [Chelonia mydas]|uniref:Solute carrier family 12 member 9 n=1 Tax=Chelonia mydas TaxID=8469 RepID=M7AQD5_CHEMY|nr:Solute carrier family 12 member 9 [Chelonia mydas]